MTRRVRADNIGDYSPGDRSGPRYCPWCGTKHAPHEGGWCRRCTEELAPHFAPGIAAWDCASCGATCPSSNHFCFRCGRRLRDNRWAKRRGAGWFLKRALGATIVLFVGMIAVGAAIGPPPTPGQATVPPTPAVTPRVVYIGTPPPTPIVLPTPTVLPGAPRQVDARVIDPRELAADPNAFKGQNVVLRGNGLNVEQQADYTWMQLLALVPGRTTTEAVVVEMRPKDPRVLKDECYVVYGVVGGTATVRIIFTGATQAPPLLNAYAIERQPRGPYGGCVEPAAVPKP